MPEDSFDKLIRQSQEAAREKEEREKREREEFERASREKELLNGIQRLRDSVEELQFDAQEPEEKKTVVICSQCKTENRLQARFCKVCGKTLDQYKEKEPVESETLSKVSATLPWVDLREDSEMNGLVTYALNLTLKSGRVSSDILRADGKIGHKYALVLSYLEREGFVYKPEGSKSWKINFKKINDYLSKKDYSKEEEKFKENRKKEEKQEDVEKLKRTLGMTGCIIFLALAGILLLRGSASFLLFLIMAVVFALGSGWISIGG